MSAEPTPAAEPAAPLPALPPIERRVLGVLIEKAKTTPDVYPMTLNALVTGCNQKNNRDPVMSLSSLEVEEAIAELKKKQLVQQITGSGRTDKYRHMAYDVFKVDKAPLAVLCELLLRGPQTEGELRGRASRMEPIPDLEALRPILRDLAQRGLVVYLGPEGRRGTTVTHGCHPGEELERLRARAQAPEAEPAGRAAGHAPPPPREDLTLRLAALEAALAQLRQELERVQEALARLQAPEPGSNPPGGAS